MLVNDAVWSGSDGLHCCFKALACYTVERSFSGQFAHAYVASNRLARANKQQ